MASRKKSSRRLVSTSVLVIITIFLLLVSVRVSAFAHPDPIRAALRLARKAGAYEFTADIVQHTDPVASIRNTGRTSKREDMHMQGQTNLQTRLMEMQFWSQGGSLSTGQGQVEIRIEDNIAQARTTGGEWQEMSNFTSMFAPNSDFMVYLNDARNLKNLGRDERTLPSGATVQFTRYSFEVNGGALAQYMRDAMQQYAQEQGELPPGVTLKTPRMYEEMVGTGEIWIGTDGLPIRQILDVQFPEENRQRIRSEITVTFTNFAEPPQVALWQWHWQSGNVLLLIEQWTAAYGHALLMGFLAILLTIGIFALLLNRHRFRRFATPLVLIFCTILITEPLLINLKVAKTGAVRQAQAAEQQQEQDERDQQQTMQENAMQPSIDPNTSPLVQAQDEVIIQRKLRVADNGGARVSAIDPDDWDHILDSDGDGVTTDDDDGTDSDGDGLTDAQEALLGTSSDPDYGDDTDSDGLTDQEEVDGFTLNGETWYTDPLNSDTNNDGLSDGLEWATDLDNDGIPDVYDRDNDGDGVPDYLDDSPTQSTSSSAVTTLNYQVTGLDSGDKPTTVEFQLRPEDDNRIWYAENIFDWPSVDNEGNVQDSDGATFADEDMMQVNETVNEGLKRGYQITVSAAELDAKRAIEQGFRLAVSL